MLYTHITKFVFKCHVLTPAVETTVKRFFMLRSRIAIEKLIKSLCFIVPLYFSNNNIIKLKKSGILSDFLFFVNFLITFIIL